MISKHELDSIQLAHLPDTCVADTEIVKQLHRLLHYVPVLRPESQVRQAGRISSYTIRVPG